MFSSSEQRGGRVKAIGGYGEEVKEEIAYRWNVAVYVCVCVVCVGVLQFHVAYVGVLRDPLT